MLAVGGREVYDLSSGKSLPEFIKETLKRGKNVKFGSDYKRRLDLLQDFDFPTTSAKVRISADSNFIGAVGGYPPELKIFDVSQLSMKFSRHFDSEAVDFLFLSPDYKKLVLLQKDRQLEFHTQGGRYHRLRIPSEGRSLCFITETAQLLITGSSKYVYAMDLQQGTFEAPLETECEELNFCVQNPTLPFFVTGGSSGCVHAFDMRSGKSISTFSVVHPGDEDNPDLTGPAATCAAFSPNGMLSCFGTSAGICRLYDIRSSKVLVERDHNNDLPIVDVAFASSSQHEDISENILSSGNRIVSADRKSIKIWSTSNSFASSRSTGSEVIASIEAHGDINSIALVPFSGMIFAAQDAHRIGTYFIPALGLAPSWCAFLDTLTEELEETTATTIYDDYQFVTREALALIGAEHLIGSPLLKAYLHGFLMDARLYRKLKAVAEPFAAEKYRKEKIQKKLESKRKMRIKIKEDVPKVNAGLAEKLQKADRMKKKKSKTKTSNVSSLLTDERFKALFHDPDFAIQEMDVGLPAS